MADYHTIMEGIIEDCENRENHNEVVNNNFINSFKEKLGKQYEQQYDNITIEKFGTITLKSGKYKGQSFKETFEGNNDYALWVYTNKNKINGPLQLFIKYIHRLVYPEEKEPKKENTFLENITNL